MYVAINKSLLFFVNLGTCPEYDTDYHGNDIISFKNAFKTSTWEECSQRCYTQKGCTHWTWLQAGFHRNQSHWNKCLIKTARQNVRKASLFISGDRNCRKCTENSNPL